MHYDSRFKTKETDDLFEHILKLKTVDECYQLFEDLATIQEIKDFTQRFSVAKLLYNKATYQEIEALTKASATTISRVSKALQYGAGGYLLVINRK